MEHGDAIRESLAQITKDKKKKDLIPYLFINKEYLGGVNELFELQLSDKLDHKLKTAGIKYNYIPYGDKHPRHKIL